MSLTAVGNDAVEVAIAQLRSSRHSERADGAEALRRAGKSAVKPLREVIEDTTASNKSRILALHTLEHSARPVDLVHAASTLFWNEDTELSKSARSVLLDVLRSHPEVLRKVIPAWDKDLTAALAVELRPAAETLMPLFRDTLFLKDHRISLFVLELLMELKSPKIRPEVASCVRPMRARSALELIVGGVEVTKDANGLPMIVHNWKVVDSRWRIGGLISLLQDSDSVVRRDAINQLALQEDAERFADAGLLFALEDEHELVRLTAKDTLLKRDAASKQKRD